MEDEENKARTEELCNEGHGANRELDTEERRIHETEAAIERLRQRIAQVHREWYGPPLPEPEIVPRDNPPMTRPFGDAAQLLEHQLASSAALIAYLTEYVGRPDTHAETCMSFMDRMSSMLGASAQIAKVVGRLRGQVSESRQTITVEKREKGARGEGVLES